MTCGDRSGRAPRADGPRLTCGLISSNAETRSPAVWNRASGAFSSRRFTTAASAGGTSCLCSDHVRWGIVQDRVKRIHGVLARERAPAGEHLEEDRAKREQVGAAIDASPRICSGARYPAVPSTMPVSVESPSRAASSQGKLGDPEIEDLRRAVSREEDVLGLQIAMHRAGRVGRARARAPRPSPIRSDLFDRSACRARSALSSVSPSRSSATKYGRPSNKPTS